MGCGTSAPATTSTSTGEVPIAASPAHQSNDGTVAARAADYQPKNTSDVPVPAPAAVSTVTQHYTNTE
jgi:hypothetical protein